MIECKCFNVVMGHYTMAITELIEVNQEIIKALRKSLKKEPNCKPTYEYMLGINAGLIGGLKQLEDDYLDKEELVNEIDCIINDDDYLQLLIDMADDFDIWYIFHTHITYCTILSDVLLDIFEA